MTSYKKTNKIIILHCCNFLEINLSVSARFKILTISSVKTFSCAMCILSVQRIINGSKTVNNGAVTH